MCYNCGCGMPDDDMGKGNVSEGGSSLTNKDFEKMAKGWKMDKKKAMENTLNLLKKKLGKKE